jgi:hypothetical protein
MQSRVRKLIIFLTSSFIGVSAYSLCQIFLFSDPRYVVSDESDPERNEQSTPRSFILPATPAVAIEQEQRALELRSGLSSEKCISRLRDLGYQIDDMNVSFNATYISGIIEFQKANNIKISGTADVETRKKIGC